MNKLPLRKIVIAGLMSAIAIFLGVTRLGFINWFPGISITIMAVPVIIGAVLEGPIVGLIVGFLFGLFSLINATTSGAGDAVFVNPLISILPRLFIGPVAWLVFRSLKNKHYPLALIVSGIAGSLTNTVLVLGMIGILALYPWPLIGTAALTNGLPEAAAAAIITLAVVAAWQKIEYGSRGSKLE